MFAVKLYIHNRTCEFRHMTMSCYFSVFGPIFIGINLHYYSHVGVVKSGIISSVARRKALNWSISWGVPMSIYIGARRAPESGDFGGQGGTPGLRHQEMSLYLPHGSS
jgi:hypothetical protein